MKALSTSELVSHPIRLRVLGVVGARKMTSKQVAEAMPEVAQATLYRHIKILHESGILEVVGRRQARGVVESTFALKKGAAHLTREQFAEMSPEEHKTCLAILQVDALTALSRYVDQPAYDTTNEGMTYLAANVMLTDEESRTLRLDLLEVVRRHSRRPSEGRRLRHVTISLIPEAIP